MKDFRWLHFPMVYWLWLDYQLDKYFRHIQNSYWDNPVFSSGKYVDAIVSDEISVNTHGYHGAEELVAIIRNYLTMAVFWYTFLPRFHKPIFLCSWKIPLHHDDDAKHFWSKWVLLNSIRKVNDAVSVLVPLRRVWGGRNSLSIADSSIDLAWWRQVIIFDHTQEHAVDGDELKFYWSALMHRKYIWRVQERLDKLIKNI